MPTFFRQWQSQILVGVQLGCSINPSKYEHIHHKDLRPNSSGYNPTETKNGAARRHWIWPRGLWRGLRSLSWSGGQGQPAPGVVVAFTKIGDDRHSLVNSEGSLKGLTPVAEDVGWWQCRFELHSFASGSKLRSDIWSLQNWGCWFWSSMTLLQDQTPQIG